MDSSGGKGQCLMELNRGTNTQTDADDEEEAQECTYTREQRDSRVCAAEWGNTFFPFILATNMGGRTTPTMWHARHDLAHMPRDLGTMTLSTNRLQMRRMMQTGLALH
jgi:hypothetical protein